MDIQFIELEHRQNVLKLMELCGIEMSEAYVLYTNSGYNFQSAVNMHFNPPSKIQQPYIPPQNFASQYNQNEMHYDNDNFGSPYYDDQQQNDPKYLQYKFFRNSGTPFNKKFPVRSHQSYLKSFIPKFFKGEEQDKFVNDLDKYVGKRTNLKNNIGNLSQTLQWSWKQKYPVLLINMNFVPQIKANAAVIFSDKSIVDRIFAEQFRIYGFNPKEYQMENQLVPIFQPEVNANNITVCRINCIDNIQIVGKVSLTQSLQQLKKKVKFFKSECIQRQLQESHIVKQYEQQRRGNIYNRPRTIKQNKKLKEDRQIRKMQEEQFTKAMNKKQQPIKSQQVHKKQQPSTNQQVKKQYKPQIKKQEKIQKPKISQQQLKKKRQREFHSLKKYDSGLAFKIRAPSGQNFMINVSPNQKIAYFFNFVAFHPEDLGFNDEFQRKFDIFMGFGGSQTLKGKQHLEIKSVFEDSQVLIIRQVSE